MIGKGLWMLSLWEVACSPSVPARSRRRGNSRKLPRQCHSELCARAAREAKDRMHETAPSTRFFTQTFVRQHSQIVDTCISASNQFPAQDRAADKSKPDGRWSNAIER